MDERLVRTKQRRPRNGGLLLHHTLGAEVISSDQGGGGDVYRWCIPGTRVGGARHARIPVVLYIATRRHRWCIPGGVSRVQTRRQGARAVNSKDQTVKLLLLLHDDYYDHHAAVKNAIGARGQRGIALARSAGSGARPTLPGRHAKKRMLERLLL